MSSLSGPSIVCCVSRFWEFGLCLFPPLLLVCNRTLYPALGLLFKDGRLVFCDGGRRPVVRRWAVEGVAVAGSDWVWKQGL